MKRKLSKRLNLLFIIPTASVLLTGCIISSTSVPPKHSHTYVEHVAKAASCLEDGNTKYYTCEGCDKFFDQDFGEISESSTVLAKTGHNMSHHDAEAGTDCQTKDGNIEYWSCSYCKNNYSDELGTTLLTDVNVYGDHDLVDHVATTPTCETAGNTFYSECSVCHKFFDASKAQIEEDSWILSPTSHNYEISVTGTCKTEYKVGESFDPTGLVVQKVCDNEGCENPTVDVTDYEIVYETEEASAFALNDTKVTIKVGEFSKDIDVVVGKKTNTITGLAASVETHCKTEISLDGVSATSGEVSTKYYSDEEHTNEVLVSEMVAGTYYAVVSSDGEDVDYEIAKAETTVTVTHDYEESPRYDVIGYKQNKCSVCDDKIDSKDLMEDKDIPLYYLNPNSDGGFDIVATFGMNTSTFPLDNKDDTDPNALRHPMWLSGVYTSEETTVDVALPKVNYKLFSDVTYVWESTTDQINDTYKLGVSQNGDLLNTKASAVHGLIKITYSDTDGGQLSVEMNSNDGNGKSVIVDSDDIINGNDSLTLKFTSTTSRQFHLRKVLLNHVHNVVGGAVVAPENMIGYKTYTCVECGTITEVPSETLMTNDDIALSNLYGAKFEGISGTQNTSTYFNGGKIIYILDSGTYESNLILPRVNYSIYGEVKFAIDVASMNGRLGFTLDNSVYGGSGNIGDGKKATIEITKLVSGEYKAVLSFSTGQILTSIITDQDVLSGAKGLPMYATGGGYSAYYITAISVSSTCTHNNVYVAKYVIGNSVKMCKKCGAVDEEDTRLSQSDDVDYTLDLYGANFEYIGSEGWNQNSNEKVNTWKEATKITGGDKLTLTPGVEGANYKISFPKVDYSRYSKVTFPVRIQGYECYYGISFETEHVWSDASFSASTYFNATVTIIVAGENDLRVTFEGQSKTIQYTNTDSDIYSGSVSLPMFISTSGTTPFTIGTPTLFEKIDGQHTHVPQTVYTSIGGSVLSQCATCEEIIEENTRDFTNSDLDYSKSLFGCGGDDFTASYNSGKILVKGTNPYGQASTLRMPRVNYAKYSKVVFSLSGYFEYGYSLTGMSYDDGNFKQNQNLTLTITVNDSSITAVLSNGATNHSATITDAKVISGEIGLGIWARIGELTDHLDISLPTLTAK